MISLVLPYPVSANVYWATRVIKNKATGKMMAMTYVTKEALLYKQEVQWRAKAAGLKAPLPGRVAIDIKLYPARPQDWAKRASADPESWDDSVRCIDLDNARKVVYDSLNGVAFTDDKMVFADAGQRMEPDGHPARVVVNITPYNGPLQLAQPPQSPQVHLFDGSPI